MAVEIYGGAMSGTSLDGVDVVLAGFEGAHGGLSDANVKVLAHVYTPYPVALREEILAICHGQPLTLPHLGVVDLAIARKYVEAILAARSQNQPRTFGSKRARGGFANAARRAGDQNDSILE